MTMRLRLEATRLLLAVLAALAPRPAPAAAQDFDHAHAAWDRLLREYVHDGGLVDYRGLQQRDRAALDGYLAGLEAVAPQQFARWSRPQREAFWINAYNAYTVRLILDHHPVSSIRDIGGIFSSVFDRRFIPLQRLAPGFDAPLSLGELEHEVLAKLAEKPLFHFAIVCASRSCPELRREAYTAAALERQLGEQARRFLADPARNDVQPDGATLRISRIFQWSATELERYPGGIRGLLRDFGPPELARRGDLARLELRYRKYDWSLNEWKHETSKN